MSNADLILDMYNQYNETSRDDIVAALNAAIFLGKIKKIAVDRYEALPKITKRSKHTVMSWFNRPDKKIPLIDLCMIADYLQYNIFSFFKIKNNNGDNDIKDIAQDFLMKNEVCNVNYPLNNASIFIKAFNLQCNTNKNIVLDNVERYYGSTDEVLAHHSNKRQNTVMNVCGCTKHTYYSWFNRSRANVHIPLIDLCKLAINVNIDVFEWFAE